MMLEAVLEATGPREDTHQCREYQVSEVDDLNEIIKPTREQVGPVKN